MTKDERDTESVVASIERAEDAILMKLESLQMQLDVISQHLGLDVQEYVVTESSDKRLAVCHSVAEGVQEPD